MSHKTLTLTSDLYRYLQDVSVREPEILAQLRSETALLPGKEMQITPEQGQFMAFLIELMGASKTLEIGVFTGYSTLSVALALPQHGRIVACDINRDTSLLAEKFWQKAQVAHKIDLRLQPALETLSQLIHQGESGSFDFVFIDADKQNYKNYYEHSLKLVKRGGLIMIDNVLWGGKVADPNETDPATEAIRQLNQDLYRDLRIHLSMIPVGDGITLVRKL